MGKKLSGFCVVMIMGINAFSRCFFSLSLEFVIDTNMGMV